MGPEIGQPPGYLGTCDFNQDLGSDNFDIKTRLSSLRTSVFHSPRKTQPKMKFFGFLMSAVLAIDSTLLMVMMQQNSVQNPNQANQMNMMLPLLLLDDDKKSTKSNDNKNMLIMMMMQGDNMGDMNSILPLLMLDDDSVDFKNFFLYSNMLKQGIIKIFIKKPYF